MTMLGVILDRRSRQRSYLPYFPSLVVQHIVPTSAHRAHWELSPHDYVPQFPLLLIPVV
jgi:hypothetical protein